MFGSDSSFAPRLEESLEPLVSKRNDHNESYTLTIRIATLYDLGLVIMERD
jgi:hypothetical protein